MASSFLRRTVYYERHKDTIRFWDWAKSIHSALGTVYEIFRPNALPRCDTAARNMDYTNEFIRMDEMIECNSDEAIRVLGDGVKMLHGGICYPRGAGK